MLVHCTNPHSVKRDQPVISLCFALFVVQHLVWLHTLQAQWVKLKEEKHKKVMWVAVLKNTNHYIDHQTWVKQEDNGWFSLLMTNFPTMWANIYWCANHFVTHSFTNLGQWKARQSRENDTPQNCSFLDPMLEKGWDLACGGWCFLSFNQFISQNSFKDSSKPILAAEKMHFMVP